MEITAVEIETRSNPLWRGTPKASTSIITLTLANGSRMGARVAHRARKATTEQRARDLWSQYPQMFVPVE